MKSTDNLILETLSQGLQASFEALNELARDLSEPRKKAVYARTDRVQRARAQVDALLAERQTSLEFEPDVRKVR